MSPDHRQVIAIDGPGAAGKSTVAKELAKRTGALLFDTGALYRAVTLAAIRRGISVHDGPRLANLARGLAIRLEPPTIADGRQLDVFLDGEDVTWAIRTPEIDAVVSEVSAHTDVRQALLAAQRDIADGARVIMVGRDIGTVVIPTAGLKIYLIASATERARRRVHELKARGIDTSAAQVQADLEARDLFDASRDVAPLAAADDAVIVDTDNLSVDEIVDRIQRLADRREEPVAGDK